MRWRNASRSCATALPRIVTSDLARTREPAERIASRFGTLFAALPDLREMSYGIAEGKPQAWLDKRFVPASESNRLDFSSVEGS
jgi:probable phosphoglycerate mutase